MTRQLYNARDSKLSAEARDLIDAAVAEGNIQKVQPAAASGNEQCRASARHIAQLRREFRQARRDKMKTK